MESSAQSGVLARDGAIVLAFLELGKLRIFELWLGVFVAWSLLSEAVAWESRTLSLLACALLIEAATTSAACSLDDVTGFRDGVDFANHGDSERYGVGKPLVAGLLDERQALLFGFGAALVAAAGMLVGLAIAAPVPWWLFALALAVFFVALNYSYGLKLSYRLGGGELVMWTTIAATLLLPYGLVTDTLPLAVLLESALLGFWMLQIAIFSNSQDAAGDRNANRHTIAASVSPRANDRFIVAVFVASSGLLVGSVGFGLMPPAFLLLLLIVPLQLRQIRLGLALREWTRSRALGFWVLRLAALLLFLVNLIAPPA